MHKIDRKLGLSFTVAHGHTREIQKIGALRFTNTVINGSEKKKDL